MNTNNISYPVFGFDSEGDFSHFLDPPTLEKCEEWILRSGHYLGMILVAADGSCWKVNSIKECGPVGPWWRLPLDFVCRSFEYRAIFEIEYLQTLTFQELQEKICDAMKKNPSSVYYEELGAGEGGQPRQDIEMQIDYLTKRIQQAKSALDIYYIFQDPYAGILPDR